MDDAQLYRDIGEMIAARRDKLGLKQADVAKRIGISRASLANMEVGRQRLLVHQIYLLASALELEGPHMLLPAAKTIANNRDIPIAEADLTQRQIIQIEQLLNSVPTSKQKASGG